MPSRSASCEGLSPTLVIAAEYDPIRDDGIQYAEKLRQAGVAVEYKNYPTIHGFVHFADRLDIGKQATQYIAQFLQKILHA